VVTVNPLPAATTGAARSVCLNESTTIGAAAVAGNTYSWTSVPAGFVSTSANPTVTPPITTTYYLTETITATGCTNAHSVVITVNPLPAATAGAARSICMNESTTIGAAAVVGNTYSWTSVPPGFVSTEANPTVTPPITTTYYLTETITATGCTNTHSVVVTVNPLPAASTGAARAVCLNESTTIGASAVAGNTYSWTSVPPGFVSTSANPTVTPLITTTYYLTETITATGCTNTHNVVVTVYPKPVLVTNPQSVCSPSRVDLTAPAVTAGSSLNGATLSYWTNSAATIPMTTPTQADNGTYYIKATTINGCYVIQPVTVTINPLPTTYSGTGSGSYCEGGPGLMVGLAGSQTGVNYTLWNGLTSMSSTIPGTGNPISFGVQTLAGYYWVLAENTTTHCINKMYDCVHITINPQLPVSISISPSANPVPAGTAVTYTAIPVNGGSSPSYQWKVNGINAGPNLDTYTFVPVNGDIITCVMTSNLPCVSGNPATSNVLVNGVPEIVSVAEVVSIGQVKCYNATKVLTIAGNGTSFIIQTGGSATMIAGQAIQYLPGTTVQPGGYMHGYITTDNYYCGQQSPAIPSIVTGGTEPIGTFVTPSFTIYPNPTTGNFTLEQKSGKLFGKVLVEIYGLQGDRVMTGELAGEKKHDFSVTDLPYGLYFVKVVADGYVETFKLVKTR